MAKGGIVHMLNQEENCLVGIDSGTSRSESMVKIVVTNHGRVLKGMMLRSLLNTLHMNGVAVESSCGGEARCGKCCVRIVKGRSNISPVRERERQMLNKLQMGSDVRLACQSYPGRDVEIEILSEQNSK